MTPAGLFPKQASLHAVKGFPAALSVPFGAFWLAYPHRVPNPRALAATEFARAVKAGAAPEELIAAAAAYAAEVKRLGTANDFIVHARTFIRQERWRDYLAAPEAATPGPAEPAHALWVWLRPHLDASTFAAWIGRCEVVANGEDQIVLRAPSRVIANRVWSDYRVLIERATGRPLTILEIPR